MAMNKPCVMGAGPMALHPEVASALTAPTLHPLNPAFHKLYQETTERLQTVFRTKSDVLMAPCSGTGINEAVVSNMFSPGEKIIVCNGGHYGGRFRDTCTAYGLDVVNLKFAPGTPTTPEAVAEALRAHPDATAVVVIYVETSTGTISPLEAIARVVKNCGREVLLIVDGVATMGGVAIETDAWGLDIVTTASQKALMSAPGLGIVSINELGWKRAAKSRLPKYYFDLTYNRSEVAAGRHAVTPAFNLIVALHRALEILLEEGLENVYARHIAYRDHLLAALPGIGFRPMAQSGFASPTVTAAFAPDGVSCLDMVKRLMLEENVTICTGFHSSLDRAIRIGHMGYTDMNEVKRVLEALKTFVGA